MTNTRIIGPLVAAVFGTLAMLTGLVTVDVAAAQDRPRPEAELTAGWLGFADDGIVNETLLGGAARFYVLPRVSIGPEVGYIAGNNHSHLMLTGNVSFDLRSPTTRSDITPFVVAGGGLFQTRESFFNRTFTSREGAFTAGGGVRAPLGDRLHVGIDVRVGWELHVRVNGFVAFPFTR